MYYNYKNSYKFLNDLSETLDKMYEDEIKKILRNLPEIMVIECAKIILEKKIMDQDDVYLIVKAAKEQLVVMRIVNSNNKLKTYEQLMQAKKDGTDIYELFDVFEMEPINKYYKSVYNKNNLPRQGWILNISADGYDDYRRL